MNAPTEQSKRLSGWDVTSLLIGIVVGTAIFKTPSMVFGLVGSPWMAFTVWGLGAVLALAGALCYAELATAYPQFGAEYVYLSRAYGKTLGFLFAWMQFTAIITGSIGAMAFVFADYFVHIVPSLSSHLSWIACSTILGLTLLQLCGLKTGKNVQNGLTIAKIITLGTLVLLGLFSQGVSLQPVTPEPTSLSGFGLALVFVLYAYGGWSDAATVTPEVDHHQVNMPRALIGGLLLISVLYMVINYAFLQTLGFEGVRQSSAPAADVVALTLGETAASIIAVTVMISALGAIHGMMFSACRLLIGVGTDHALFERWSRWNKRDVPVWSLISLSALSQALTLLVGTQTGKDGIANSLSKIGISPPDWSFYDGGFNTLVAATAPVFWFFFALSGFAVIVLRWREPDHPRPFQVPWYPVTPLVFVTTSVYMLYSSLKYAGQLTLLLFPLLVIGYALYFCGARNQSQVNASHS